MHPRKTEREGAPASGKSRKRNREAWGRVRADRAVGQGGRTEALAKWEEPIKNEKGG
jgi:hypothetical protein